MSESFGDMLTRYRQEAGLSQTLLAAAAGIDRSYVSRAQSGYRNLSRDVLLRVCDVLALSPEKRTRLLWAAGYAPDAVDVEVVLWASLTLRVLQDVALTRAAVGAGEREAAA